MKDPETHTKNIKPNIFMDKEAWQGNQEMTKKKTDDRFLFLVYFKGDLRHSLKPTR